jgi:hypothetical protein
MKKIYLTFFLFFTTLSGMATQGRDTITFKGQLSTWFNYNSTNDEFLLGGRYIPQLNASKEFLKSYLIDAEVSANLFGILPGNPNPEGKVKPYRAWGRFSSQQFELRAGLQKINFGSATMLRPLMWFDQMDPRDPLQLTDGVWGILGRYYFLNNTNIWLWSLYGNKNPKGWEFAKTNSNYPEFGGRIQVPISIGEAALSYHFRIADTREMFSTDLQFEEVAENRIGLDAKFDWVVGFWAEGAWVSSRRNLMTFTNQTILNVGVDYTFGFGSGLYVAAEQLLASYDEKPFAFGNRVNFSLLSISYPVSLFDNVGTIFYYSWEMDKVYSFLNWQRQYNQISLHLMAYWNPETIDLPQQNLQSNMFGGKGVQLMFVFNH